VDEYRSTLVIGDRSAAAVGPHDVLELNLEATDLHFVDLSPYTSLQKLK
jgi:hypothetical protein